MKEAIFRIVFFSTMVAIALGFNLWLASGCDAGAGMVTWEGKKCVFGPSQTVHGQ